MEMPTTELFPIDILFYGQAVQSYNIDGIVFSGGGLLRHIMRSENKNINRPTDNLDWCMTESSVAKLEGRGNCPLEFNTVISSEVAGVNVNFSIVHDGELPGHEVYISPIDGKPFRGETITVIMCRLLEIVSSDRILDAPVCLADAHDILTNFPDMLDLKAISEHRSNERVKKFKEFANLEVLLYNKLEKLGRPDVATIFKVCDSFFGGLMVGKTVGWTGYEWKDRVSR